MLSFAKLNKQVNTEEQINIGIIRPLQSPFNLFLNFEQLINPDARYIYYFVHTLGQKRIVMWGVYDKSDKMFIIESGCRFNPNQLLEMTNKWKENGYKYTSNSVYDQITPTLSKYLDVEMWTYDEYVDNKRFLRYLTGELSHDEMAAKYGEDFFYHFMPTKVDYTDEFELQEFILNLQMEVQKYEKLINRTDISDNVLAAISGPVKSLLLELTSRFDRQIQDNKLSESSYESILNACPTLKACKSGNGEECEVYSFGTEGHLSDLDPDQYL